MSHDHENLAEVLELQDRAERLGRELARERNLNGRLLQELDRERILTNEYRERLQIYISSGQAPSPTLLKGEKNADGEELTQRDLDEISRL